MAIRDKTKTNKNRFIDDRNENVFIGLDSPIRKGVGLDGYFAGTKDTISAIKNNLVNLLRTEEGERVMHPKFGIGLRKFLFQPIDDDISLGIRQQIIDKVKRFLPMVKVKSVFVSSPEDVDTEYGIIKLTVVFSLVHDSQTNQDVTITIGDV